MKIQYLFAISLLIVVLVQCQQDYCFGYSVQECENDDPYCDFYPVNYLNCTDVLCDYFSLEERYFGENLEKLYIPKNEDEQFYILVRADGNDEMCFSFHESEEEECCSFGDENFMRWTMFTLDSGNVTSEAYLDVSRTENDTCSQFYLTPPGSPGVPPGSPGVPPGVPPGSPGAPGVPPGSPGVPPGAPESPGGPLDLCREFSYDIYPNDGPDEIEVNQVYCYSSTECDEDITVYKVERGKAISTGISVGNDIGLYYNGRQMCLSYNYEKITTWYSNIGDTHSTDIYCYVDCIPIAERRKSIMVYRHSINTFPPTTRNYAYNILTETGIGDDDGSNGFISSISSLMIISIFIFIVL